jgi:hypothetical protein
MAGVLVKRHRVAVYHSLAVVQAISDNNSTRTKNMFAKIALPATATKLGTLFGLPDGAIKKFRFSFPEANSNDATVAKPTGLAAGVIDTPAKPNSGSMVQVGPLGSISVSGTVTDYIVLEYTDPVLNME